MRGLVEELIAEVRRSDALELERAFTVWLKRVLLPARVPGVEIPEVADLTEVRTMLAERVKQWTLQWKQEGLQEGLQEGRQEGLQKGRQEGRREGLQQGEARVLERLLIQRFGPLPPWALEKLHAAGVERLERWADRLLEAESLEALLGDGCG